MKQNLLHIFSSLIILIVLLSPLKGVSQKKNSFWKKSDTLNKKRRNAVYITKATAASVALIGMNQLWYANYPRSSFHFINDNDHWLQMDKVGHVMASYYVGKLGMEALNWAGESKKNQLIYGAPLGFVFLTSVEILDGFSERWGFSTGDLIANATGTGLLIGQELLWNEQRIILKYSFHTTSYAKIRPEILGENFLEQTLKDYNGQTYWLSANLWSFNKKSKIPRWINLAFGYGAEGMITAKENQLINSSLPQIDRYRQFYLSLDVDLTKIKTRSKLLKTLFSTLNFIKIPAPTLEINTKGELKFHAFYF